MDGFCRAQFKVFGPRARLKEEKNRLTEERERIHERLLAEMDRSDNKNFQVSAGGAGEETLQVKRGRYYNYKAISDSVLQAAQINWPELAAPGRKLEDQVDHIIGEIQKVRRQSKPHVEVKSCGARNRDRLALAEPGNQVERLAQQYMEISAKIKAVKARLDALSDPEQMEHLSLAAAAELDAKRLRRRVFDIQFNGQITQFVVRKKTEARTKPPTKKQLVQLVRELLLSKPINPATFMVELGRMAREVNKPIKSTSIVFEKAPANKNAAPVLTHPPQGLVAPHRNLQRVMDRSRRPAASGTPDRARARR